MWMQSSFGTRFVRVHFGNARWSLAWVNQRGLRSRNKILPRSAQILFVIGTAFTTLVNTHTCSSNHEPNHEADRDPKRLSERDSFLCEQAHWLMLHVLQDIGCNWLNSCIMNWCYKNINAFSSVALHLEHPTCHSSQYRWPWEIKSRP